MKKKKPFSLSALPFLYLYAPVVLFLLTWIHLYWSIPVVILLMVTAVKMIRKDITVSVQSFFQAKNIWYVVLFLLCLAWCFAVGIGGFVCQPGDWEKHNLLFGNLIDFNWPVRYEHDGLECVLSYYIGSYLIPAVIGKFTDFDMGQNALMVWFALGIFLTCYILYQVLQEEKKHWYAMFVIFAVMVLFGTFITPISGIYRVWDSDIVTDGVHWLASNVRIQYTSNMLLLRWVAPQFVPAALATAMLVEYRKESSVWGLILAPLALCSTFAFVGMAFIMLILFFFDFFTQTKKERLPFVKALFSLENITAFFVALLLVAYIACNFLQSKPESANLGFKLVDYMLYKKLFIFFHFAWLIWIYLLWPRERKNKLLYVSAISLFLIPFIHMGEWGDFCMRSSIPALMILCILVAKDILWALKEKKVHLVVGLMVCLLVTSAGPIKEVSKAWEGTIWGEKNYSNHYDYLDFIFYGEDYVRYQYVDWEPDGFAKYLLQQ